MPPSTLHPAVQVLHAIGREYPDAWHQYACWLADPPEPWPDWCWCPVWGAMQIVRRARGPQLAAHLADVPVLAAMAAWRGSQGIYRFDPELFDVVRQTEITGTLPGECLLSLPEWCVYIETPGMQVQNRPCLGFWTFLDYYAADEGALHPDKAELQLVLHCEDLLQATAVPLGGTLQQGLEHGMRGMERPSASDQEAIAEVRVIIEPLLSLVLYLCARNADLSERPVRGPRVLMRKKRGPLLPPPPSQPRIYQTGVRVGSALRKARLADTDATAAGSDSSRKRKRKRGHMRKAHWHHYWRGSGEQRMRGLRWLYPIPVNLKLGEVPELATAHAVRKDV